MLSFALDQLTAIDALAAATTIACAQRHTAQSGREGGVARAVQSTEIVEKQADIAKRYTLLKCVTHSFYAPLWLGGPTVTFDSFADQLMKNPLQRLVHTRSQSGTGASAIRVVSETQTPVSAIVGWGGCWSPQFALGYAVRVALALTLIEICLRCAPVYALAKWVREGGSSKLVIATSDAITLSFTCLHILWLKFVVIWRLARLWAALDGIDAPENMIRCMSNNYTIAGFWRGWHASFNKWLVRYIYVPIGGRNAATRCVVFIRRISGLMSLIYALCPPLIFLMLSFSPLSRNSAAVFIFVAIWHELSVSLIAWGALNALFMACESVVQRWIQQSARYDALSASSPFIARQLRAVIGTANVWALIAVNLIGYSIGVTGFAHIAWERTFSVYLA